MLPPIHIIDRQQLAAPAGSISFANIDTLVAAWDQIAGVTSRHLVVILNAKSPDAVAQRDVELTVNVDGGGNYNDQEINGVAGVAAAARRDGQTELIPFPITGTTYANAMDGGIILIPHAFNALNHKCELAWGGAAEDEAKGQVGRWASNNPITRLDLTPSAGNFDTGTIAILAVVDERFLIEEQILSGADGTFTFSNIPQGDGGLIAIGYLRSDVAGTNDSVLIGLNGDVVAANYNRQRLRGRDAGTDASTAADRFFGSVNGDNSTAGAFGALVMSVNQYAKAVNQPHYLGLIGYHDGVTPRSDLTIISGRRSSVEPIASMSFAPTNGIDFKDGSMMSLYYLPSNRELIERKEFIVDEASKTFWSLGQFKDVFEALIYQIYARSDRVNIQDNVLVQFNDDGVAANYNWQLLNGGGAVVGASRIIGNRQWMNITGNTAGALEYGGGPMLLPSYAETDRHKHFAVFNGRNEDHVRIVSGRWLDTDAITKTDLSPAAGTDFMAGSFIEESGVVPLDTVIRREKDKIASGRDDQTTPQTLRNIGRAWRH